MFRDNELIFSEAQAITSTGDTAATKSIDAVKGGDATYNELFLQMQVAETVTSAGSATVQARFETSDASDFTGAVTLFQTGVIPKATLVAGYVLAKTRLPLGMKRYSRVVYNVGTAALTAGKFTAFLTPGVHN